MSETMNQAWIERQTASPESRRLYEEERLILWAAEAVAEAMARRGLTRAQLADALGTSRPNVTQLLNGSRNMTLRTLAAVAHACGARVDIQLEPLADWRFQQLGDGAVQELRRIPVPPVVESEPPQLELDPSFRESKKQVQTDDDRFGEFGSLSLVA